MESLEFWVLTIGAVALLAGAYLVGYGRGFRFAERQYDGAELPSSTGSLDRVNGHLRKIHDADGSPNRGGETMWD